VIAAKILGLLSAALGAGGTLLLFFGSFAYEAPAAYMSAKLVADMTKRNKRRQFKQRLGLLLLLLSFILAGASVCASP
jgi:hypothetical protein